MMGDTGNALMGNIENTENKYKGDFGKRYLFKFGKTSDSTDCKDNKKCKWDISDSNWINEVNTNSDFKKYRVTSTHMERK